MKYLSSKNLIFIILVLAFLVRLWGVGDKDMLGDEATYAFRSIGYIDYLGTSFQTQPIDWFKDGQLPYWSKLSFHDHPPLVFIIQNIFFRIFGDNLLVARLPSIIFGTLSIFLIYLIVKQIYADIAFSNSKEIEDYSREETKSSKIALLAAFIFGFSNAMIAVSRTSLIEPILLFFILLNIYYFFRFLKNRNWWWAFGLTLGLVMLTKYIGVFIAPALFFYLIFKKREVFKDWRLYAALLITLILFSPVIIYNFYLYKERGHFDLQFSYLFNQKTPEWSGLLGKVQSPFSDIGKNLLGFYGIFSLFFAVLGLGVSTLIFIKKKNALVFWWLYTVFLTILLIKIGSGQRFLALYGSAFAIFGALAVNYLWNLRFEKIKLSYLFKIVIVAFLVFEIWFSLDNNFLKSPDYGVAKLDNYFKEEFKNKESGVIPQTENNHLNEVINKFAGYKSEKQKSLFGIVYNDNVALPTLQWIFYRRFFYHSVPAFYVENFVGIINKQGINYFKGFDIYFVQSTENTALNPFKKDKTVGQEFENNLRNQGLNPVKVIYGQNHSEMFRVYKFSI